jgi:hypothetical protein
MRNLPLSNLRAAKPSPELRPQVLWYALARLFTARLRTMSRSYQSISGLQAHLDEMSQKQKRLERLVDTMLQQRDDCQRAHQNERESVMRGGMQQDAPVHAKGGNARGSIAVEQRVAPLGLKAAAVRTEEVSWRAALIGFAPHSRI